MVSKKDDDLLGSIEAEQSMMQKYIDENKWHCQRSDELMSMAGRKGADAAPEGDPEVA